MKEVENYCLKGQKSGKERGPVSKRERENLSYKKTTECCVMEFRRFKKAEKTCGQGQVGVISSI